MYKLLTTAAVIMTVATPTLAWDNAKDLTKNLGNIYNNLDGQTQFGKLQGDGGELNTFFGNVNTGVTHLTLNVDDNNAITAVVNEGTTLEVIQNSAADLINRVNYDVFVDDSHLELADQQNATYVAATDYTTLYVNEDISFPVDENSDPIRYNPNFDNGLLGVKLNALVADVDTINNVLISTGANAERDGFIAAWGDGTNGTGIIGAGTSNEVNIASLQTDIAELNIVSGIISNNADSGLFNDNIGIDVSSDILANSFNILGLKSDGTINDGTNSYDSIYAWATAP